MENGIFFYDDIWNLMKSFARRYTFLRMKVPFRKYTTYPSGDTCWTHCELENPFVFPDEVGEIRIKSEFPFPVHSCGVTYFGAWVNQKSILSASHESGNVYICEEYKQEWNPLKEVDFCFMPFLIMDQTELEKLEGKVFEMVWCIDSPIPSCHNKTLFQALTSS